MSALRDALRRLDEDQGFAAYAAFDNALEDAGEDAAGLEPKRLAILRNMTVEPMLPILRGEMARLGWRAEVYLGDYDAVAAEVLAPDSGLHNFDSDVIILVQWLETLSPALAAGEGDAGEVARVVETVVGWLAALRERTAAPVLMNNFPDAGELNARLAEAVAGIADVYSVGWAALFARLGEGRGFDARSWKAAQQPLSRHAIVPAARAFGGTMRALAGKAAKCLVLDCDGTLWGGVVGEDGVEGIDLSEGHLALQRHALDLHDRGIMLAICSKNEAADVDAVFEGRPEMVLKPAHFAAMRVDWSDKAGNLGAIAADLNIGVDALAFADDSAYECAWVRDQLSDVNVLHLTGDAGGFATMLQDSALFESVGLTDEDRKRGRMMAGERARAALRQSSASLDDYLLSLGLVADIGPPRPDEVPRVAQLTQRTNQFNLTTRRYTEGDIQRFLDDPAADVVVLKLRDKVAELGLIGVAITEAAGREGRLDSLLLSCRALGRGAEDALLACALVGLAERGCRRVIGGFRPTARNAQVREFYGRFGFTPHAADGEDVDWVYDAGDDVLTPPAYPVWLDVRERT